MDARKVVLFWAKVDKRGPDECWNWTSCILHGYGWFTTGHGRARGAHRIAWELAVGPIPDGLFVCHRCDNRACVNPGHLFLGTNADNMRDMREKGRRKGRGGKKGTAHCMAKLTDSQVLEIRGSDGTQAAVAAAYGVSQALVHLIRHRKIWKHI